MMEIITYVLVGLLVAELVLTVIGLMAIDFGEVPQEAWVLLVLMLLGHCPKHRK
jgi:hypothetical protein